MVQLILIRKRRSLFTPYGQKLHEATKSDIGPTGDVEANTKDPMVICDPL